MIKPRILTLLAAMAVACGGKDDGSTTPDVDGDGFDASVDCDDNDPDVHPNATEICDGVDNDCDGLVDDADDSVDTTAAGTWYLDADFDGYGDPSVSTVACALPAGYTSNDADCDDGDATINPGAADVCDGVDNNCDDVVDDGGESGTWYLDADGDGYGDDAVSGCVQPEGTVAEGGDCDDGDDAIFPGASELCDGVDNDCDTIADNDGTVAFESADGVWADVTARFSGTSTSPASTSLENPGTVWFCNGTYYTNITVKDSVDLRGRSGSWSDVTLDGGRSGTVVHVQSAGADVGLYDLTITDGMADAVAYYGLGAGGGIACEVAASVTGSGLYLVDNNAYYGGAIQAVDCDLTLSDSVLERNSATYYGGALSISGGSHVLDSVDITDGEAGSVAGAIYSTGNVTPTDIELTDVVMDNNSDTSYGGALYTYNTNLTMKGTSTGSAAITNNSSSFGYGVGYFYPGSSSVTVSFEDVDFGSAASGNDNTIPEIYHPYYNRAYVADGTSSFLCDYLSCGTSASYIVGSTGTQFASSGQLYGNTVLADSYATIDYYAAYIGYYAGCTVDLYIVSSNTAHSGSSTTWTVEWSDTGNVISSPGGWLIGSSVGVLAEPGTYYAFLVGMRCTGSSDYIYYDGSASGSSVGFGSTVGYVSASTTYASLLSGSVSLYGPSSSVEFYQYIGATQL